MDYYTYHFIVNGRVAHAGITSDTRRQQLVDQARWAQGHIQIVGGPMSEQAAMAWKRGADRKGRAKPDSTSRAPAQRQEIEVGIERDGDIVTVNVAGRLGELSALAFHDEIDRHFWNADRGLLVNMENITFISSSGLRVILFLAKQLAERRGTLVLYGLSGTVRELFVVSGFSQLLNIVESREAAMKIVAADPSEPKPGPV